MMKSRLMPLVLLYLFSSCETESSQIISEVNGRSITQADFVFAYETSPAQVLEGSQEMAYQKVLDRMTQRILLAQEAQRTGLHLDPETARELRYLEDGAIRRQLFMRHIREQVEVSENECRMAFNTDQRTLWIQHAVLEEDELIPPGAWNPEWIHAQIDLAIETVRSTEFGAYDLLHWNAVDTDLEQTLFALRLGEVSQPILKGGLYHIFRLVNEETNQMASEEQFFLGQEHYRSTITKRREHALAFKFVQTVMQPQELIISGNTLAAFTTLLWKNQQDRDSLKTQPPGELTLGPRDLSELNDLELGSYASGSLTVADFSFAYKMNPLELSKESFGSLQQDLVNAIGLYVRDIVFAAQGRAEGLADLPVVKEDLRYWQERLLASKMEDSIFREVAGGDAQPTEDLNLLAASELNQLTETLRQNAQIHINQNLLMSTATSGEGLSRKIDFFASHLN